MSVSVQKMAVVAETAVICLSMERLQAVVEGGEGFNRMVWLRYVSAEMPKYF